MREYDAARDRVRTLVTEISRLRSETENRDLQAAEQVLRIELGDSGKDAADALIVGRKRVPDLRLRIDAAIRLLDAWQSYKARLQQQDVAELTTRRQFLADKIGTLERAIADAQTRLSDMERLLMEYEEKKSATSALAQLHVHGSAIGLVDGRCPLCGSALSGEDFKKHLEVLEKTLSGAAARAAEFAASRSLQQEQERRHSTELAAAMREFDQISATVDQLERERVRLREDAARLAFTTDPTNDPNSEELEAWIDENRRRVSLVERAIAVLESSRLLSHVTELEKELAVVQKTSVASERQLELVTRAERNVKDAAATVKRVASEQIDERLASINPLLSELYVRLRPHIDWPQINYLIRGDVRRFLSLRVGEGDGLNLRFMFSSGQRRAVGLAFLLSICLSRPWCALRSVILDDPVQHIDDYRALHLVEALAAVRQTGFQVICTVEDQDLGALLARRLRSTHESPGALVELQYMSGNGVTVERTTDIRPFPVEILKSA
jgi:hypothetical protein